MIGVSNAQYTSRRPSWFRWIPENKNINIGGEVEGWGEFLLKASAHHFFSLEPTTRKSDGLLIIPKATTNRILYTPQFNEQENATRQLIIV